ncbi:MAG: DUF2271 domain-containing protein [Thiohalophilus sp.]|uniref:DUF2271 domain-containing protein n=1 Tax=Thiohalophilus sp. TaxID=3028392 RepID=UPI00286FECA4|nr:DUF2271 domain-containing protein [Thiohalophilus sp.]MDR9437762.1 DUF2271 domain-containing protein [Thiohalophilus sp.]
MKKYLVVLGLAMALVFSASASAREVTFSTQLTDYRGDGAYLAMYLTDSNGVYQGTLWIAGQKSKYYKHLRGWARGSGMSRAEYDGLTGASITSGRTLKMTMNLDDSLIDNGYQIHVDTSVEDMRDNRSDVVVPLTTEGAGKPVSGRGYVKSFSYHF